MRTIIAGSRRLPIYSDRERVKVVADAVIKSGWRDLITLVISGGARGIDLAGENWAKSVGVPIERYDPDWELYGKGAGFIRNFQMANAADALILIWDGMSKGSKNMKEQAEKLRLKIFEYLVDHTTKL